MHPGTNVLQTYTGNMWWDEETDGELMYPAEQRHPTEEQMVQSQMSNPDETAAKGLWSNPDFLANLVNLNSSTKHTQFADFHGHGWAFRAVFKKDRSGNYLDYLGRMIPDPSNVLFQAAVAPPTPEEHVHGKQRDGVPVHLMDIHLEKGMHCIDCHFNQDNHGNTKLYGEVARRSKFSASIVMALRTSGRICSRQARPRRKMVSICGNTARPGASRGSKSAAMRSFNIQWSKKTSSGKSSRPLTP